MKKETKWKSKENMKNSKKKRMKDWNLKIKDSKGLKTRENKKDSKIKGEEQKKRKEGKG